MILLLTRFYSQLCRFYSTDVDQKGGKSMFCCVRRSIFEYQEGIIWMAELPDPMTPTFLLVKLYLVEQF